MGVSPKGHGDFAVEVPRQQLFFCCGFGMQIHQHHICQRL
jgi:hypothetical protein